MSSSIEGHEPNLVALTRIRSTSSAAPSSPPSTVNPTSLEPDRLQMQRVAQGDVAAYRQLVDAHLGAIVTYLTRLLKNQAEAEELAQETFLRVWQKADGYEPKARVSTWIHRIAHNLALDGLRKKRGASLELDDERDAAPASNDPARLLERKAVARDVQSALDELPVRQKMALLLSHEQGLSLNEIAAILELNPHAVESLLARGRRRLREVLSPPDEAQS